MGSLKRDADRLLGGRRPSTRVLTGTSSRLAVQELVLSDSLLELIRKGHDEVLLIRKRNSRTSRASVDEPAAVGDGSVEPSNGVSTKNRPVESHHAGHPLALDRMGDLEREAVRHGLKESSATVLRNSLKRLRDCVDGDGNGISKSHRMCLSLG